jgi:hypothetical protein
LLSVKYTLPAASVAIQPGWSAVLAAGAGVYGTPPPATLVIRYCCAQTVPPASRNPNPIVTAFLVTHLGFPGDASV